MAFPALYRAGFFALTLELFVTPCTVLVEGVLGGLVAIRTLRHATFHVFVMAVATVDFIVVDVFRMREGDAPICRGIGDNFRRFV